MIFVIPLFGLLVLGLAVFALSIVLQGPRFMGRSIEEVAPYLVMVNEYKDEIDRLLDPKWQENVRDQPEGVYRADVCRSIRVLAEMFERQRKNVRVLNQCAETEYFDLMTSSRLSTAVLQRLKAEHEEMESELKRFPEPPERVDVDEDWDTLVPTVTRQQLRELEREIEKETIYCEETRHRLEALNAFISQSGWLLSAMEWPILKLRLSRLIPYQKWTWIRVPRLASFGQCRGVYLPGAYRSAKIAFLDLIDMLHPSAEIIRLEIQSQM